MFTISNKTLRLIALSLTYIDFNSQWKVVYTTKQIKLDSLFKRKISPLHSVRMMSSGSKMIHWVSSLAASEDLRRGAVTIEPAATRTEKSTT